MRAISPARTGWRIVVRLRRELKRVAVAARYDRRTTAPVFLRDRRRQKIVCLIAWRLRIGEPACRDELRQDVELIHQLGVKVATALVAFERPVAVGRRVERVPADQHGSRLLLLVEPQQEIRETEIAPPPLLPRRRIDFGSP